MPKGSKRTYVHSSRFRVCHYTRFTNLAPPPIQPDDIKRIHYMCHIRELPTINQKRKIMNIKELYDKVSQGAPFYVNFKKRTVRVGKKAYDIKDIEWDKDLSDLSEKDILDILTAAYEAYKHSVPSERSDSHRKSYFKALPYEELSDDDILYGAPREFSRFTLEISFLIAVSSGKLKWNNEWGTWFWQSPDDKDFVILREWVEPKND